MPDLTSFTFIWFNPKKLLRHVARLGALLFKILQKLRLDITVILNDKLVVLRVLILLAVLVVVTILLPIGHSTLGLLLLAQNFSIALRDHRNKIPAQPSLLEFLLFVLGKKALNVALGISAPFPIELVEVNEFEWLSAEFFDLYGSCACEASGLGHWRGQQEERGPVANGGWSRTVLAGWEVGLGKVAVRDAAVLDQELLELEFASAAVH